MSSIGEGWRSSLSRLRSRHGWRLIRNIITGPLSYSPIQSALSIKPFALKRLSWFQVFSLPTLRLYFRLLREGKKFQNYGKDDYYQAGGDFLVDRKGNILFAHRSQDPADRPPIEKLLEAIDRTGISAGEGK